MLINAAPSVHHLRRPDLQHHSSSADHNRHPLHRVVSSLIYIYIPMYTYTMLIINEAPLPSPPPAPKPPPLPPPSSPSPSPSALPSPALALPPSSPPLRLPLPSSSVPPPSSPARRLLTPSARALLLSLVPRPALRLPRRCSLVVRRVLPLVLGPVFRVFWDWRFCCKLL